MCAGRTFAGQSGKVLWVGGLFRSKAAKCAAHRTSPEQSGEVCPPADFRRAKRRSVPARRFTRAKSESGTGRRVCPPGEKKPGFFRFFSGLLRACISGRKPAFFAKKTLDFPARQSDECPRRAGNRPEGTNRAGGKSRRRAKGAHPMKTQTFGVITISV